MDCKDTQASGSHSFPYETCATTTIYTPDDRQKEHQAFFRKKFLMFCPILISCVLPWVIPWISFLLARFEYFGTLYSVVLMGLWIVLLLTISATMLRTNNSHFRTSLLTSILLVAFAVMSFCRWPSMWLVRAALAVVIASLQIYLLLWTLRTFPFAGNKRQDAYYMSIKRICWIATTGSLMFLLKSFQLAFLVKSFQLDSVSPSTWALACAMASSFLFACSTFAAAQVNDSRGKRNEPTVLFSDDAFSNDENMISIRCPAYIFVVVIFVLVWPLPSLDYNDGMMGSGCPTTLGLLMLILEQTSFAACRFHILPNASILVETMNKSYVYDQVLHAQVESTSGATPEHTEECHVYCACSHMEIVKVQLSGERLLYLTPKHPTEFVNAVANAISSID